MRRIRVAAADDGWSLIESVVALAILALVLTALGAGTLTVARAGVNARNAQQAANILNQQVEQARSMEYAALTMVATDLVGDPRVGGSGPWTYLPTSERLVVDTVGSLAPHRVAEVRDSTVFAVARYVTDASGAAGAAGASPSSSPGTRTGR
ncbi:MAG: type II secretion system GspH family protein [Actinomycetota bacterium]|nr:type II secretion system GspH family protein [Actinomycetota bacterium]